MKAFQVFQENEQPVLVVAEKKEDVTISGNQEVEELCEVEPGCYLPNGERYFLQDEEESTFGDYIGESGHVLGAEDHTGQGQTMGYIDEERTNKLMREKGALDFHEWEFDLWLGSFWNGSNWRVVVIERF
jgi:hypothetical protein